MKMLSTALKQCTMVQQLKYYLRIYPYYFSFYNGKYSSNKCYNKISQEKSWDISFI